MNTKSGAFSLPQPSSDAHLHQLATSGKLEAIGQLASGIAHEINTPIQYVSDNCLFVRDVCQELVPFLKRAHALAEGIVNGQGDVSSARTLLDDMARADFDFLCEELPPAIEHSLRGVERIRKIVSSMKQFSHPGDGEMHPEDINRAIENTVMVATNEWKYIAETELDLAPELPEVECHLGELNQVFLNIVVNAAQAIAAAGYEDERKGLIRIATRCEDDIAIVQISDNGTGMPDEVRARVFEPFFTTKEVGKGTGQGLSIAYQIVVNRHNGSIGVQTQAGKGTTFEIRLPVRADSTALVGGG